MNELALFAGAGGGLLATKYLLGWHTVCYVEYAAYPVEILKARISEGYLDDAPIWDDCRTFDGRPWRGLVDIVTAGFPCQPFSAAGKRGADADLRNGWPDTIRIIREVRPDYCLLENVPGLLSATGSDGRRYFGRILGDLAESGYNARWRVLSAGEMGAPHRRKRIWIMAYTKSIQLRSEPSPRIDGAGHSSQKNVPEQKSLLAYTDRSGFEKYAQFDGEQAAYAADGHTLGGYVGGCRDEMAHANSQGLQEQRTIGGEAKYAVIESLRHGRQWWAAEPDMGRVADGVAARVDRLAAIGNGQVPAVVAAVWELLTEQLSF